MVQGFIIRPIDYLIVGKYIGLTWIFLLLFKRFGGSVINFFVRVLAELKSNFNRDPFLFSFGITVLIIYLIELHVSIYIELIGDVVDLSWLLWVSNILPLVLSYSFIFRSRTYATLGLLASLVYEVPWNVDFFGRAIFNAVPFGGLADYMFSTYPFHFFANLNHVYFLPLFAYGVYKLGVDKNAYKLAFLWGIILVGAAKLFTLPVENANCAFHSCLKIIRLELPPTVNVLFWSIVPQLILVTPLNFLLIFIEKRLKTFKSRSSLI